MRSTPQAAGEAVLDEVMVALREQGARRNWHQSKDAGELARWLGREKVAIEVEDWFSAIPRESLARAVITNVPIGDVDRLRPKVAPMEALRAMSYDGAAREAIRTKVSGWSGVAGSLGGSAEDALASCTDDYDRECVLVVGAWRGHADAAIASARSSGLANRRPNCVEGIWMVGAVEWARTGDPRWVEALGAVKAGWHRLFVARGLVGLIPWGGYPFADY